MRSLKTVDDDDGSRAAMPGNMTLACIPAANAPTTEHDIAL
jgi:hypothetical protein